MKINYFNYFFVCVFFLPLFLVGQNAQLGFSSEGGVSWMSLSGEIEKGDNPLQPSANLGFFYRKKIGDSWSLGTAAGYSYLASKGFIEKKNPLLIPAEIFIDGAINSTLNNNGDLVVLGTGGSAFALRDNVNNEEVTNHLHYAYLKGYVHRTFNHLAFQFGVKTMYLTMANADRGERMLNIDDTPKFDYGLSTKIEYKLVQQLSLTGNIYIGMKNLSDKEDYFPRRNRQVALGLNYYLN